MKIRLAKKIFKNPSKYTCGKRIIALHRLDCTVHLWKMGVTATGDREASFIVSVGDSELIQLDVIPIVLTKKIQ